MVEGPGATRNARKVQPAVGCCVQVVAGEAGSNNNPWIGQTLQEAFCVGKEVFLVFSNDAALRLHFGMNGSLALSKDGTSVCRRYNRQQVASLQLHFQKPDSTDIFLLECFSTTVSQVSARVARSKRDRLQQLDCCATNQIFESNQVVSALQSRPDAMLCDVLLDQNKYPGVGNIIKIEGLHRARMHPKRLVRTLTDAELQIIIKECRYYALGWLKSGRAPPKQVYNQTTCGSCHTMGSVRMVKLGQDLSRVTFWCEQCQPLQRVSTSTSTQSSASSGETQLFGKKRPLAELCNSNSAKRSKQLAQEQQQSLSHCCACPQHGSRTFCIKRVRHSPKEENRNRLFGTCKVNGCPFFAWADTHFPNCPGCRRKTVLRVSKKEQSSGRWFFSCSKNSSNNGCKGMFAWATPQQLTPLGKHLTPLL